MANKKNAPSDMVLINMKFNADFLKEIDRFSRISGYPDRSSFIRAAVYEKLSAEGSKIARDLSLPPPRTGIGGTPSHKIKIKNEASGPGSKAIQHNTFKK